MKMFSIFDLKAEVYSRPFFALTDQEAVRTFADAVNAEDSPYNRHPEDYTLFSIGEFSDRTCEISTHPMQHLGNAISFVRESDQPMPLFGGERTA